jgi:hypothetical protein
MNIINLITGKRKVAKRLIEEYNEILLEGEEMDYERFLEFLRYHNAEVGICAFAHRANIEIKNPKWVKKHVKCDPYGNKDVEYLYGSGNQFWFKIPNFAETKEEAVDLIKKRIEILKTWL